jgi:23S rRNA pseudouridine1911/1915/1917 synthase
MSRPEPPRQVDIPRALAGERLDRACAALFPDLSRTAARKAIDEGRVSLDGRRVRACARPTPAGALLTLAPAARPTAAPPPGGLTVVHEDEHLIVVAKPPGQHTQPTAQGSAGTLLAAVEDHLRRGRRRPYVGLVHRLDRDASGLVVFGCAPAATAALSEAVREHLAERRYEALVRGVPAAAEGRIDLPLRHDARSNRAAVDPAGGRPATTSWRVTERAEAFGLVRLTLWLETGRTHQIRVHLAATLGPIVGDRRYGDPAVEGAERRLYLHATRLVLPHPATGAPVTFDSPLPAEFGERLRCP